MFEEYNDEMELHVMDCPEKSTNVFCKSKKYMKCSNIEANNFSSTRFLIDISILMSCKGICFSYSY